MKKVCGWVTGLLIALTASSAMAQGEPAQPQPSGEGTLQAPKAGVGASATGTVPAGSTAKKEAAKDDDGTTDHEKVVGKFGVMYFGLTQQPIGQGPANGVGRATVQTPVIGARYWFQERMGIDAGIGLNFFSSSTAVQQSNLPETNVDGPAVVSFALHAGLPLAFAYAKHYKFLLVPEVNFGYATQTEAAQNPTPGSVIADIHRTGLRLDVGARVGTEIQFGFIGIPELALQASVGLNFRRQVWHASQDASTLPTGPVAPQSSSIGQNDFGTTVQSDPWAIFTNNISAIYYFP